MSQQNHILILNMTGFFKRELRMYALGDIRFKNPISLKKAAYIMGFLLAWSLPMLLIVGIKFNPVYLAILLGPPILLGNFAGKPIWGGKPLFDFIGTSVKFIQEPKGWTDLQNNNMNEDTYFVDSEIWVSRRRELQMLADIEESQLPPPSKKKQPARKRRPKKKTDIKRRKRRRKKEKVG